MIVSFILLLIGQSRYFYSSPKYAHSSAGDCCSAEGLGALSTGTLCWTCQVHIKTTSRFVLNTFLLHLSIDKFNPSYQKKVAGFCCLSALYTFSPLQIPQSPFAFAMTQHPVEGYSQLGRSLTVHDRSFF